MTLSTYPEKAIRYLYMVGLYGGIRRAADILGFNPSVVSRQIALLERTIQLPLLEKEDVTLSSPRQEDYWLMITPLLNKNAMSLSDNSAICAICVEGPLRCALDKGWSRNHYPRRE